MWIMNRSWRQRIVDMYYAVRNDVRLNKKAIESHTKTLKFLAETIDDLRDENTSLRAEIDRLKEEK
jgi:cell division protein FtsB